MYYLYFIISIRELLLAYYPLIDARVSGDMLAVG